MKTNEELLLDRTIKYDKDTSPRVGDFLLLPNGEYDRFTYKGGNHLQTGGICGSYYLGNGYETYSGSLDRGIKLVDIEFADNFKTGKVWFFNHDIARAHNGVYFEIKQRVYKLKHNADISGLDFGHSHYWLTVTTKEQQEQHRYKYLIDHHGTSVTAFNNKQDLVLWLGSKGLELSNKSIEENIYSSQELTKL
jgi:hypothetical protein